MQYIIYRVWRSPSQAAISFGENRVHYDNRRPYENISYNIIKYRIRCRFQITIDTFNWNHIANANQFRKFWYAINHITIGILSGADSDPLVIYDWDHIATYLHWGRLFNTCPPPICDMRYRKLALLGADSWPAPLLFFPICNMQGSIIRKSSVYAELLVPLRPVAILETNRLKLLSFPFTRSR